MRTIDQYHKWVEWSDVDQVYVGKCPDLITGIHGDDPVQVYRELGEVLEELIDHFQKSNRAAAGAKDASDDGSLLRAPVAPRPIFLGSPRPPGCTRIPG